MRVVHVVQPRAPYVCAHGGDTSNHPSNTAGAHTAAITEGFDCVEVDVSLTADHQLILLHNRDLRQLTGRTDAMVHEFPLEHLLQLTWQTGEPPLTVSQAVAATAPHVDLVVLDVKTSALPRLVTAPNGSTVSEEAFIAQLLLELLSAAGHNNTLIWGKSDTVVEHVKQSVPAQLAGYTVMMDHTGSAPHFEDPLRTRMKHVEVAAVFHGMLNQSLMGQLTAANKSVFAWSVDDPGDMQRMLDLGVHGMVTNRPKVLLEAVRSRQ
eukprot:GHUV01033601.1.p1 GENE.GHUV01033601.1~~GHUV01033601.1.p1  ORF type:complete len:265 (+),score=62.24 GHUV01033601.1:496-1290(+)